MMNILSKNFQDGNEVQDRNWKKKPQNTGPANKLKISFKIGCIRLYTHWKLNGTQSKKKILLTYLNYAKIGNLSIYKFQRFILAVPKFPTIT